MTIAALEGHCQAKLHDTAKRILIAILLPEHEVRHCRSTSVASSGRHFTRRETTLAGRMEQIKNDRPEPPNVRGAYLRPPQLPLAMPQNLQFK
jgi:hypothetical protein